MSRFDYLIEKVNAAPFRERPFRHIYIEDFFSPEDFAEITGNAQIDIPPSENDNALFDHLFDAGYKIIDFPGCIVDQQAYVDWHAAKGEGKNLNNNTTEGFGITLRLMEPASDVLVELKEFLARPEFNAAISGRYGIELEACSIDGGIQKYLDGYEISPHPDIRRKATTFMVNINPHDHAEECRHHTHYMRFKPEYSYVREFWKTNKNFDRCWVPWDWCETIELQTKNNSIVIFSPNDDTLHAVKADYDHLGGQRTQLYGNLWYKDYDFPRRKDWEELAGGSLESIDVSDDRKKAGLVRSSLRKIVRPLRAALTGNEPAEAGSDTYHQRKY